MYVHLSPLGRSVDRVRRVQFFFVSQIYLGTPVSCVPWDSSSDPDDGPAVNDALPLGRTGPTLVVGNLYRDPAYRAKSCRQFVLALVAFGMCR